MGDVEVNAKIMQGMESSVSEDWHTHLCGSDALESTFFVHTSDE
jgi:hypothetical protein